MAVEAVIPRLSVVVFTAAIDSINPCAIGVLILLLSVMLGAKRSVKRMLGLASLYILAVYTVYLLAGLGLMYFLTSIPLLVTEYIAVGVAVLIVLAGFVEIKDFFWYARGFTLSIPPRYARMIHQMSSNVTIPGVIALGAFVSGVELPCTGAPYLAIITLLSQSFDMVAFGLLIFYNIIFVSPLIIIMLMVAGGKRLVDIKKWHHKNRAYMRLVTGFFLVLMGWLLMLIADGTINLQ